MKNPLTKAKDVETFGLSNEQKASQSGICNIAIGVDVVDGEFGKHQAILKANTFFDCFASNIFSTKTKILIDTTYYLVLDQKNEEIGNGFRVKDEHLNYLFSKQIKDFKDTKNKYLPYFEKLIRQDGTEIDKQIKKSLSWKKRALEATNYNEAILWHWISIENLFNSQRDTTKLIFHFAPKILTKAYIYHFIQKVWNQIRQKADFFSDYTMPQEAQKIIINRMSSTMTYKEFIKKVKEICQYLDKNSFFHEQLRDFIEKFEDEKQFKAFIENYKKQVEQKLFFFYRIRNKIAHNASNEYNATIAYYRDFASFVSTNLIWFFTEQRVLGYKNIDEIINKGQYEYNKMLLDLEKYGMDSILDPANSNKNT